VCRCASVQISILLIDLNFGTEIVSILDVCGDEDVEAKLSAREITLRLTADASQARL
jgi:hypothetical protein